MVKQLAVHELKALLDGGARVHLVDVRQPWEAAIASLPGSQLIPLPEFLRRAVEVKPEPGAVVVTYCHHGVRSLDAALVLNRIGIAAASLAGGIDRWSEEIDPSVPRY